MQADLRLRSRRQRLERGAAFSAAKVVAADNMVALLESVLECGDIVCLEGDNQKQADFLSRCLAKVDPKRIHDLHLVLSTIALADQLEVFERGIARQVDFSYSGPQGLRLAKLAMAGKINIGNIHTYLELYSRYFTDLCPNVCCLAAEMADREGNLYTGDNTEDSPVVAEATAFKSGIVIAQVNQIVDKIPRVDIPGDWIDYVCASPKPFFLEPLFTRDPAQITETMILTAMLALKGIYAKYLPKSLNHGVGFNTAAIELLLPTYGEELGLRGKACLHWLLNPHPTMIPAIEAGFVKTIYTVGSEMGMSRYIAARPDIFPIGRDGSMRSNRAFGQMCGHYATDMFIGASLQIDPQGNSSTATTDRIAGFGGAPNFGCDPRGRRHCSPAWLKAGEETYAGKNVAPRGRRLVVQLVESFHGRLEPTFVEKLDAWELQEKAGFALPPIMIYGDDVTHIVTEEGIANLLQCRTPEDREQAIRGVAGYTPMGLARDRRAVENLRDRGIIQRPEDLGIRKSDASRDLLAARTIKDLVRCSGGLYAPPTRFRNW
ncbi:MAG: malonate decarboxylase subunit alpha [Oligosphaeraceae bacterium]|nr:malonate decarboxylase subunit alpha [Oligosphaeraceae bacterium]